MFAALMLALLVVGFAVPTTAFAQPFQVVNLDPSLDVSDINDNLLGVGVQRDTIVPFVLSPSGAHLFPDLARLRPARINTSGLIVGVAFSPLGVFRVTSEGAGYTEALVTSGLPGIRRLTESGRVLIGASVINPRAGTVYFTEYFVWDGTSLAPVVSTYELNSSATVMDLGEDGTIGGSDAGMPFLKRPGEPLARPWSGPGRVTHIGAGGHVIGDDGAGTLIVRRPDGSFLQISGAASASVSAVNFFGGFVGSAYNQARARTEAFLVKDGQVIQLNDYFSSPTDYLTDALDITDSGIVLARLASGRRVLLVPPPATPFGLRATVGGRFVWVSWEPVPGAIEYLVEAGSSPGARDFFNSSVGAQRSVSGPVPPGRYYVRVRARSVTGILSAPSQELLVEVF